ncbi:MAG: M28 family peptidase, partial [Deltaproteobacteria bacterium]
MPLLALAAAAPSPAGDASPAARAAEAAREAEAIAAEIGPRPTGSAGEDALEAWVRTRLEEAGWRPRRVAGQLVACRGDGTRLFLAHLDTVPGSPGAVDNAAGVVALVHLARDTAATDLCLAFPRAEEAGLVGSEALAAAWPDPGLGPPAPSGNRLPSLVVALDLVGQGRLSVTGLGPRWSGTWLRWLVDHADVASPYAYRVVSRALPAMERSDHRPFA